MRRHIIYIINPISGTRTKKDLQQYIEKKTAEQKIPFQIFSSVASGDYSFLHSIIKEQNITDVVIAGGDGTINQVIGNLADLPVNFGIIPCGSGNGLALASKIPKAVDKAIKIIFSGTAQATDAFYLNYRTPAGNGRRFGCMLCGLGYDAKVAHDFADQPKRGFFTYARMAYKNLIAMKKQSFQVRVQGTSIETEAYFISIANSNQFGSHFTIAPKASLSDGLLDIIIVTSKNKFSFIWQMLQQLAGWNKLHAVSLIKGKRGIIYFQTGQISISNLTNAPLHIDGEPAEPVLELEIIVRKNFFRLLRP